MKNTGKRGGKAAGGSGRKDAGPGRAGGDAARTKKTPGKPAASRKLPPWMPEPPPSGFKPRTAPKAAAPSGRATGKSVIVLFGRQLGQQATK